MVVFTCQHCNEALKKPAVEKHYSLVCRRKPYLTCVDCLVDFRGDEYTAHTSCVSEDQRYGDKNFVPKPVGVKQNNWMDIIQSCIARNDNPQFKPIFQRLSKYSNVPRKKPKFINFLKNGLNIHNESLASEIFDVFQNEFMKNKQTNSEQGKGSPEILDESLNNSGDTENKENKKNKKKEKKRNHISESSDVLEKEETHLNGVSDSPARGKKKKSKKEKLSETQNGLSDDANDATGDISNLDTSACLDGGKKNKKKNKSESQKENLEGSQIEQEGDVNNVDTKDSLEKLSKKELKKLKKKQKYEAELKEIEENQCVEEDNEVKDSEAQEDASEKGKAKKHKKRKANLSESEQDNVKKQKVQEESPNENGVESNSEVSVQEPNSKAKFNWEEVIKELLHKSSEHEMSIKRLSKKVLAEYQAVKGDRETFEQLMSKFNKKINKIPGVRILKDKAKLLAEE